MEYSGTLEQQLCSAICDRNIDAVASLLSKGADPYAYVEGSCMGWGRPIHVAVRFDLERNSETVLQVLLDSDKVKDVNLLDDTESTPLMHACLYGNIKSAKLLLQHGADVKLKNVLGNSVIHCSVLSESVEMVVESLTWEGVDVNELEENGKTPLMIACEKGYKDIVIVLLTKGANVNMRDRKGNRAAKYAKKNKDIKELLHRRQQEINEMKISTGNTTTNFMRRLMPNCINKDKT